MFGAKTFLEKEREDWHVDCWRWLVRNSRANCPLEQTRLVLPNKEFFPPTDATGHERAEYIFQSVKALCGMSDWEVRLEPQGVVPKSLSANVFLEGEKAPLGTFRYQGDDALITYDPEQLTDPGQLITTFAHELGHYFNNWFAPSVPGGDEMYEPSTDLTLAYFGFPLFGLIGRQYKTFTDREGQVWQSWGGGYLTVREWEFALAMYCVLSGTDIAAAKPYLNDLHWKQVNKAIKHITKNDFAAFVMA